MNDPICKRITSHQPHYGCPVVIDYVDGDQWYLTREDEPGSNPISDKQIVKETLIELVDRPVAIHFDHMVWSVQWVDEVMRIRVLDLESSKIRDHCLTTAMFKKMLQEALAGQWSEYTLEVLK